jgi:hypothetical protein
MDLARGTSMGRIRRCSSREKGKMGKGDREREGEVEVREKKLMGSSSLLQGGHVFCTFSSLILEYVYVCIRANMYIAMKTWYKTLND